MRATLGWLVTVHLAAVAWSASAETADTGTAESAPAPGGSIETIVIQAQRRGESQLDVPISVNALSADSLERANVNTVAGLQQIVPGFTMSFAGAHGQPTIRGVGTQVAGVGLPPNVAIYIDGVYRPNAIINNVSFQDVAAVEVLKGPQGTLYGKNATGGAVLVTTKGPTREAETEVKASYRSYDESRLSLFSSGPLTDTLAGSISVYGSHAEEGYYDNIAPGVDDKAVNIWGVRAKGEYTPSDAVSFTLTVEHNEVFDPYTFAFTDYEGISIGALGPTPGVVSSEPRDYSNDYRPIFDTDSSGVFLKADFDFEWARLSSVTGAEWQDNHSGYDVDGSSLVIQHVDFPGEQTTYSQSFDLASSSDGPLEWLVGAFFYEDESWQALILKSPPGPFSIIDGTIETHSLALYGDVTYEVLPGLFVTGGVRYSQDDLDLSFKSPPSAPETEGDTSFDALTPRVAVRFNLTDTSMLYASYNQGYKTGGYNLGGASTVPVDPEEIDAYEVGYKATFGRWDLQAAAFRYDYTDLQVSAYQGPITTLVNAAEARIYGAEVQVGVEVTDRLRVDAGVSYLDGEYEDFPGAPHYTWDPTLGIAVFPDDASGNAIVNSPDFSGRIGISYLMPVSFGSIELDSNYQYQSDAAFDAFEETKQDAYGVLNVGAAWLSSDDSWKVRGFVENATDEDYVRSIFQQPVAFSAYYQRGTTFGVEVQFRP